MKTLSFFLTLSLLFFFTGCSTPNFGKKVKKEYYTGGKIRSEFFMTDNSEQNGLLKKYGYEGHLTSVANIRNGVNNGVETLYDTKGRVLQTVTYINGKKHGIQKSYYPNGDVMIAIAYQNDMRNGEAFMYRRDGSIDKRATFRHDKMIN